MDDRIFRRWLRDDNPDRVIPFDINDPFHVDSFNPEHPDWVPNRNPGVRPIPFKNLPSVIFLNEVNNTLFRLMEELPYARRHGVNTTEEHLPPILEGPTPRPLRHYQRPVLQALCRGRVVGIFLTSSVTVILFHEECILHCKQNAWWLRQRYQEMEFAACMGPKFLVTTGFHFLYILECIVCHVWS
ncbi:MAG: hypothetical protein GY696_15695 [Gammaproteobacteria bacterium]|nr:hypothetical protein [Gammaproteobacteria bacterium]